MHLAPGAPVIELPLLNQFSRERRPAPDPRDATVAWADIVEVRGQWTNQWWIDLAGRPPPAADLTNASTVLSYGLVFDRTGDGVADVIVGISNDARRPGDFRVWLTDLATGETEEQIGPPYGLPVEFSHPDEHPDEPPTMHFTFLTGTAPGLPRETAFYAWSSIAQGGDVVIWDYAPDAAWLRMP